MSKKNRTSPSAGLMPPLPSTFIDRMTTILGDEETARLKTALDEKPSVSIRINRRKVGDPGAFMQHFSDYNPHPVPWCASGFYLDSRPDFVHDPLLHAGTFYVQEAASMVYETIVGEILKELHTDAPASDRPLLVADMCAAPGGKSTAMLNALTGKYILVANEFDRKRAYILKENVDKWGDPDVVITNSPTSKFGLLQQLFDIIAVDAPCSGEGMMRREPIARTQWNPGLIEQCALLQREILDNAVTALKPGGCLIYSTCTFNNIENEENVKWLREEFGLEILRDPHHYMPHRERCEGLFVVVLRKPDGIVNTRYSISGIDDMVSLLKKKGISIISAGTEKYVKKGNLEIPSSKRVLAYNYDNEFPSVDLSLSDSLAYLRRNTITLPEDTPKGYVTLRYEGYPLGLVKNIGNRANNLYPAEWRLLS